ncbi:MAG TPA: phosphoenolpyruvate synthase, partial [Cytophagales bacterium]|nr:phosphoenolpyruvate synthase [Cytophagales bacterium]
MRDVSQVGGKNASLGEMLTQLTKYGINVPQGFALTAEAYREFLKANDLTLNLQKQLSRLNNQTLGNLSEVASECRNLILTSSLPVEIENEIRDAYEKLKNESQYEISVAVRSSATIEDSPTASFAGQHNSFLNVKNIDQVLESVKKCYASAFNDRAIKYRIDNGFDHLQMALSVGIQQMVRSDKASAGVAFTIEPENGNKNLIYITGAWGLGESVVQGAVNTDEFYFFKPTVNSNKKGLIYRQLGNKQQMVVYGEDQNVVWQETPMAMRDQYILTDDEICLLGNWCCTIEKHYQQPMDIEWAKDGKDGKLYILQARPETVTSKRNLNFLEIYHIQKPKKVKTLCQGLSLGHKIGHRLGRVIRH